MEALFIIKYNYGFWIHKFCGDNSYLPLSSFCCLVEGKGGNRYFEELMWYIVKQNSYS